MMHEFWYQGDAVTWGWGVAWGPLCAAGPGITAAWKAGAQHRTDQEQSAEFPSRTLYRCCCNPAGFLHQSVVAAGVRIDRVAGVPIRGTTLYDR